jgi:hypothetical protein
LEILDDELVFNDIVKHRHVVEDHPIEVNIAIDEIGYLEKRMSFLESIGILNVPAAIVKRRFFSQVLVIYINSIQGIFMKRGIIGVLGRYML